MARKVVAIVLLGLLACAALASAQDTANQTKVSIINLRYVQQ
jgi:hypothetical protein